MARYVEGSDRQQVTLLPVDFHRILTNQKVLRNLED